MNRRRLSLLIFTATALWLAFMLVSLRTGWLNHFFFDADVANVQGMDFFPVERAFLNFVHGQSQYDTFNSTYGPRASWYLYHPALAFLIGPLLAPFSPWTAYSLFIALSILLLCAAAYVMAKQGRDPVRRALVSTLLLCSFPTYILFFSGNAQAVIILAFALIFAGVESLRRNGQSTTANTMITVGLLLSLCSKPFVFVLLPLLLLLDETRRATLRALAIYILVSAAFILTPALNPVPSSWATRQFLLTHPQTVATVFNPYVNGYRVLPPMLDNTVHWIAMTGLSRFRLLHIDVMSLPTLLDRIHGAPTPAALYTVPTILLLELSLLVWLMRTPARRLEAALLTLMAASLVLFLTYGLVWEYHYTMLLPIGAMLLMRDKLSRAERTILALTVIAALPSLYILERGPALGSTASMLWIDAERLLPAVLVFILLLTRAAKLALTDPAGLRWITAPRRTN